MALSRAKSVSELILDKLTDDHAELLRLQTLEELPKARYATKSAVTALPAGRARKVVYSHIEVYKMVEAVATQMRESGVRPGVVCAMLLENSVEAIVYFLASAWIGAIAAPIDTSLSPEDTVHALRSVKAATIVSPLVDEDEQEEDPLFQKVHAASEELGLIEWHIHRTTNEGVVLEMHGVRAAEGAAWKGGAGDFTPGSDQVAAYHPSVSGETSLVVPLTHGNFAAAVLMFADTYQISADDNTILTRPWCTIDGLLTILATVYSGGHIVVPGKVPNPDKDFLKICAEYKVDWFTADPNFLADLCEVEKEDADAFKDVNLTFVRSVAGNIDAGSHEVMEKTLRAPVLESYGTPETCGIIACNVDSAEKSGTKGEVASGVKVKIFNETTREEEERGTEGLVGVTGDNVASQYLTNEEANKTQIIREVDEDGRETTYFLTGDKGVFDGEGYLKVWERSVAGRAEAFAKEANEKKEREAREALEKENAEKEEEARQKAEKEREAEEELKEAQEALAAEEARQKGEEEAKEEEERLAEEGRTRSVKKSARSSPESFHSAAESESETPAAREARGLPSWATPWKKDKSTSPSRPTASSEETPWNQRKQSSDSSHSSYSKSSYSRKLSKHYSRKSSRRTAASYKSRKSAPGDVVLADGATRVVHDVDPDVLKEIIERLGTIEENQRKLESEMRETHRLEMEEMKALLQQTQEAYAANPPARTIPVNLDEVNSAISRATQSATASKENTERAVQAANAATAAAEAAAAKFALPQLSMVTGMQSTIEVKDPEKVHKTVMVSLDEVETAIKMHPSVERARAFGRPDKRSGMEVYCVIKPKVGARVSEPWLKLHAQSVLPAACVPKKFFAKKDLKEDEDREGLAADKELLRISALSGYTPTKVIKSPAWTPAQKA